MLCIFELTFPIKQQSSASSPVVLVCICPNDWPFIFPGKVTWVHLLLSRFTPNRLLLSSTGGVILKQQSLMSWARVWRIVINSYWGSEDHYSFIFPIMFLSCLHFTNQLLLSNHLKWFYLQKPRPGTLSNQTRARYLTFSVTLVCYIQKWYTVCYNYFDRKNQIQYTIFLLQNNIVINK